MSKKAITAEIPAPPAELPYSPWYVAAMECLVGVIQELSQARDLESVMGIVRETARSLTGADGATFVLRDGDNCYYAEENAISPLWKGRRFPMSICISGWVMENATNAVIEDVLNDPRIPADVYLPTFVKSMAMVPIRRKNPIGAIGNYWDRRRMPTQEEVAILQALADSTSIALENAELYGELQKKVHIQQEQEKHITAQHETLEVFTRALAHDLKEPVRTIHAFSTLVGQDKEIPQKSQLYIRHIHEAASRMGMLIDTVFQYTQLEDPVTAEKKRCSMDMALVAARENLHTLIEEHSAVLNCDSLPEAIANMPQMVQVLQNLLANAIHHGGHAVTIHVDAEEEDDQWVFSVRDDGPGIANDQQENIFLPFKRLMNNEACAGLGLSICRKIVESHGGSIWCQSTPGHGAAFYFTLPKTESGIFPLPAYRRSSVAMPRHEFTARNPMLANVLLVDDRETDIELARVLLFQKERLQCNLLVGRDGHEGLDLLREQRRQDSRVDLVLLDINMPSMNGFEMLEQMQRDEAMKDIAVVMCTGSTYEKDKQRAKSLGAVGYLVKPPSFDQLKPILENIAGLRLQEEGDKYQLLRAG